MIDDTQHLGTEMNRGFLQVLVLVILEKSMYGYMMIKHLETNGYTVEENTLYPLLRRLEKNLLIKSEWSVSKGHPKKFYVITPKGRQVQQKLLEIWRKQNLILERSMEEHKNV